MIGSLVGVRFRTFLCCLWVVVFWGVFLVVIWDFLGWVGVFFFLYWGWGFLSFVGGVSNGLFIRGAYDSGFVVFLSFRIRVLTWRFW